MLYILSSCRRRCALDIKEPDSDVPNISARPKDSGCGWNQSWSAQNMIKKGRTDFGVKILFRFSLFRPKGPHLCNWKHAQHCVSIYFGPFGADQNSKPEHGLYNRSALIASHYCDYARSEPHRSSIITMTPLKTSLFQLCVASHPIFCWHSHTLTCPTKEEFLRKHLR